MTNKSLNNLDQFIDEVRESWKIPGLATAVVQKGELVYIGTSGIRDADGKLPVTPDTLFAIGSSTKAFTSTAIGMLVDEGKLDLDCPIIEYLPDFRLFDEYATLHTTPRDILCHRTGLPGYDALWLLSDKQREDYFKGLRFLKPTKGFRETFQYNNLMYMAAGILVGRLSGKSWEEFVAERIFKSLKMDFSNFSPEEMQRTPDFSKPYMTFTGSPIEIPFRNTTALGPAGSINSNIVEMAHWVQMQLDGGRWGRQQIISSKSLDQTHLPHMVITDPLQTKITQFSVYGQGWGNTDYMGNKLIEHGGNIDGFSALVSLMPEEKTGVVVLSNSLNIIGYVIARTVYDLMFGSKDQDWNKHYITIFTEILQLYSGGSQPEEKPVPDTKPSFPLSQYEGIFAHPAFGPVEIKKKIDRLTVCFQSGATAVLDHWHFDSFRGKTSDFYLGEVKLQFHLNKKGAVDTFTIPLQAGVEDILFKRQDQYT
ncbi:serine hydrolase [Acidobacteriota bacterium]